jgi:hypothetical protein
MFSFGLLFLVVPGAIAVSASAYAGVPAQFFLLRVFERL